MSWKPEFLVDGKWSQNAVVFATEGEALANARDKFMVWTMPKDFRAVEVDETPNYTYGPNGLERIIPETSPDEVRAALGDTRSET